MHTCLSFSNIGGRGYVEGALSGFIAALNDYCDSIEWCNVALDGPDGEGETRCWRVNLKLRIFDEIVRAMACLPEGVDAEQSLSDALADIYASATTQMAQIAKQHQGCCCHRTAPVAAPAKALA